jgi:hypothetical protein
MISEPWLIVAIVIVVLAIFAAIWFGFWMGRQSIDKPVHLPTLKKPGGEPLFEEDPYADAMRETKSEGSL